MEFVVTLRLSPTEAEILAATLACGSSRPVARRSGHDRNTVASATRRMRAQLAKDFPDYFSTTVVESEKERP